MSKTKKKQEYEFTECPCVGATLDKLIQPAVLAILAKEKLHGYELARKVSDIPNFLDEPPDMSGVYRMLKALEKRGMVTSDWDILEGARPKRIFAITDRGRQCLELWTGTLQRYNKAVGSLLRAAQKALT